MQKSSLCLPLRYSARHILRRLGLSAILIKSNGIGGPEYKDRKISGKDLLGSIVWPFNHRKQMSQCARSAPTKLKILSFPLCDAVLCTNRRSKVFYVASSQEQESVAHSLFHALR